MDDYDIDDLACPCGAGNTHSRRCADCDEGMIDAHEEDPINEPLGSFYPCGECDGSGIQRWCPKCGRDWWTWPEAARKLWNPEEDPREESSDVR